MLIKVYASNTAGALVEPMTTTKWKTAKAQGRYRPVLESDSQ